VSASLSRSLAASAPVLRRDPGSLRLFFRTSGASGSPPVPLQPGERLRQPHLAATLSRIAAHGEAGFYQGPVAEAAAERLRAQTRLDGAILEMRQRVLLAWKSYEMARAAVDALGRGAIPEAEAALRVAEAAYRFGERGILEVLDAQRVLRSVRADLIQARFELQAARISLDRLAARYIATAR